MIDRKILREKGKKKRLKKFKEKEIETGRNNKKRKKYRSDMKLDSAKKES